MLFSHRATLLAVAAVVVCSGVAQGQRSLEELERSLDSPPPSKTPDPADAAVAPDPADATPRQSAKPGYLGVVLDEYEGRGVIVLDVRPLAPAALSGLARGDVIIAVNSQPTRGLDQFGQAVGKLSAGDKAEIEILRSGQRQIRAVTLAESGDRPSGGEPAEDLPLPEGVRPPVTITPDRVPRDVAPRDAVPADKPLLGVHVVPVQGNSIGIFGSRATRGALVDDVFSGTPAHRYGLPRGALIVACNELRVDHPDDLIAIVRSADKSRPVELTYVLAGRVYRLSIPLSPEAAIVERPPLPPRNAPSAARGDSPDLILPAPPESDESGPALRPPARPAEVDDTAKTRTAAADADRITKLEEQLRQLQEQAAAIERELSELKAAPVAPSDE